MYLILRKENVMDDFENMLDSYEERPGEYEQVLIQMAKTLSL